MPSKSKEREAQEKLVDLRLRANLAFAENESIGAFGRTNDSLAGDQKLWDQLKAEDLVEQERARKNQPAFKLMHDQWSRSIAELRTSILLPDVGAELPLTDKPLGSVQKAFDDFKEVLSTRGQVLSKDGETRLIKYVGNLNNTSRVVDGVTYRVACDNLNTWIQALNRLIDLNAFSEGEYTAIEERQPEPVEESSVEEPSADDLLHQANAGWFAMFDATWNAWLKSLDQDPWNFVPDEAQKLAALKMLQQFGTTPDSWDRTRRALGRSGVWPNLATAHEVLAEKVDAGEFRLDTVEGRAAYTRAHNQITYGTV
jgi:hypothetical protein